MPIIWTDDDPTGAEAYTRRQAELARLAQLRQDVRISTYLYKAERVIYLVAGALGWIWLLTL